jgi:hypothetical protein
VWQVANGWPTREFIENAQRYKMTPMSPSAFLSNVVMEMGPTLAPLHVAGLLALFFFAPLRRYRALAWIFLLSLAVFMLNRSKPYYVVAAFPPLIAGCAVWIAAIAQRRRWVAPAVTVYTLASAALTAPFAIPLLPIERFLAYQDATGVRPSSGENRDDAALPQFFADRFGWRELVEQVAGIVNTLPANERDACLIVGDNYGQAGAINYFGGPYGLRAVSQHNSYYLWGYGSIEPKVFVLIGQDVEDVVDVFYEVREVARTHARYAMPVEVGVPILVCRRIKLPLDEAWRMGRMFI